MKYIKLNNGKYAIVDDEDYEELKIYRWYFNRGYAVRFESILPGIQVNVLMHKQITSPPKGLEIDHINRNKLDNRRANLRVCTRSENLRNRSKQINNTSGYKGVAWHKRVGKWQAVIMYGKHNLHLGYFNKIEDAAKAYNSAAMEYYGEFAVLNDLTNSMFLLPS